MIFFGSFGLYAGRIWLSRRCLHRRLPPILSQRGAVSDILLASGHRTTHQCAPFHIKIDVREADLQTIEVFGDSAIADFAEPEDAFENAKRMLHISANARLGAVLRDLFIA